MPLFMGRRPMGDMDGVLMISTPLRMDHRYVSMSVKEGETASRGTRLQADSTQDSLLTFIFLVSVFLSHVALFVDH